MTSLQLPDDFSTRLDGLIALVEQVQDDSHYEALAASVGAIMQDVWNLQEQGEAAQAVIDQLTTQRDTAVDELAKLQAAITNWPDGTHPIVMELVNEIALDVSGETVSEIDDNVATNLLDIANVPLTESDLAYQFAAALTVHEVYSGGLAELMSDPISRERITDMLQKFITNLNEAGEQAEQDLDEYGVAQ